MPSVVTGVTQPEESPGPRLDRAISGEHCHVEADMLAAVLAFFASWIRRCGMDLREQNETGEAI